MKQPITRRQPLADSFSRGLEIIRLQAQVQAKSILLLAKAIFFIGVVTTGSWVWWTVEPQILLGAARWSASYLLVQVFNADWTGLNVLTDGGVQRWSLSRIHADPWHQAAFSEAVAALKRAASVCMTLAIPASIAAYWGAYRRGQNAAASLLARGQKVVDERSLARLVRAQGDVSTFRIGQVPLPKKALNRSIMFLGAPQTGKSLSMKRWLRQVRARGDMAIVFDKVGDVTAEFYDAERGDVLLNPMDARSPDWSPWAEMRGIEDAYRLAKSLIPSVQGENNFFHVGAQDVFATMLLRIARLPKRSLLGLLEAALVLDKAQKAELLARTAAAKHYDGDHRSGHDVDATMAVFTQALRFLRSSAGGRDDFSIRDFITDTITRLEKPSAAAIDEIRARFSAEMDELLEARNLLAAGDMRKAFRLVARISVAYPLLPEGLQPPQPEDNHAAWWDAHRDAVEDHWREQDAVTPGHLQALETRHTDAAARLKRRGAPWLFIGSTQRQMHAVRPVLSLWLDAVADTIMSLPDNRARRIWLMLDELQSLQQLPSLQPLLTEGAKYGVCVCAGVQNMGQIRQSYGRDAAEVILSLFNTKAFFRLQEPDTAHWAERAIGSAVKEHVHESIRLATSQTMDGASMSIARTTEPIVMAGEVIRLNDLHCYLMLPGDWPVGKIALTFDPRRDAPPAIAQALVPQRSEDTIYHALDRLGWAPLPTGGDGDDPGAIARTVAGGAPDEPTKADAQPHFRADERATTGREALSAPARPTPQAATPIKAQPTRSASDIAHEMPGDTPMRDERLRQRTPEAAENACGAAGGKGVDARRLLDPTYPPDLPARADTPASTDVRPQKTRRRKPFERDAPSAKATALARPPVAGLAAEAVAALAARGDSQLALPLASTPSATLTTNRSGKTRQDRWRSSRLGFAAHGETGKPRRGAVSETAD